MVQHSFSHLEMVSTSQCHLQAFWRTACSFLVKKGKMVAVILVTAFPCAKAKESHPALHLNVSATLRCLEHPPMLQMCPDTS